ncbi:hypothetical protein ACWJJH_20130 [Endozoicomonadaceae bacterium StTr2]
MKFALPNNSRYKPWHDWIHVFGQAVQKDLVMARELLQYVFLQGGLVR